MNASFYHAKLLSLNTINVMVFTSMQRTSDDIYFFIVKDFKIIERCTPSKSTSMNNVRFVEIKLKQPYEYGHHYEVFIPNFGAIPLDVSQIIYFEDFDKMFYYDGDDLGSTYYPNHTNFAIWAPLASDVYLTIYYSNGETNYKMKRSDKGVYRLDVKGDLKNIPYQYIITNSEVARVVNDPYGKGISLNSKYSVVVDLNEIKRKIKFNNSDLNKTLSESCIYELNIRDFTIDKSSDIVNKGKYLGLIESGRKTKGGHPAGLDYLKFLGISHVQLLPILDFANVDDANADKTYNWGYDVTHFFALEGSYSLHPEIAGERILEFRKVVSELHKNKIGVIIDVVYNHIFSYESSLFEKVVPGYYFRKNNEGRITNGSGCGNDLASEKSMVRKLIIDSVCYLIDMFDIDGLRFDLMGLLDIETIKAIQNAANHKKKNFFIYGEGWHIPTGIPSNHQASIPNAFKMDGVGFFNDSYRDILKGSCFDLAAKGYINGDYSYVDGAYFAMLGSCVDYTFNRRFLNAGQSINYIECHDNGTLYDKLVHSLPDEEDDVRLQRVKFANTMIAFSFGAPFYHMGQEIGLSKHLEDNTYNMGDRYNMMDYKVLDKRFEMASYFKDLIAFRQKVGVFKSIKQDEICDIFHELNKVDNGGMRIKVHHIHTENGEKNGMICINPSNQTIYFELDDYYDVVFSKGGKSPHEMYCKHVTQSPFSIIWLIKR